MTCQVHTFISLGIAVPHSSFHVHLCGSCILVHATRHLLSCSHTCASLIFVCIQGVPAVWAGSAGARPRGEHSVTVLAFHWSAPDNCLGGGEGGWDGRRIETGSPWIVLQDRWTRCHEIHDLMEDFSTQHHLSYRPGNLNSARSVPLPLTGWLRPCPEHWAIPRSELVLLQTLIEAIEDLRLQHQLAVSNQKGCPRPKPPALCQVQMKYPLRTHWSTLRACKRYVPSKP